jgi:hypothetical protein
LQLAGGHECSGQAALDSSNAALPIERESRHTFAIDLFESANMKKSLVIAGVVVLVALGLLAWLGRDTFATVRIGAAYVAKQTCSCLFIARRTSTSCSRDYDAGAAGLLRVDIAATSVTASAFGGLLSRTAQFEDGFGCHLVN